MITDKIIGKTSDIVGKGVKIWFQDLGNSLTRQEIK